MGGRDKDNIELVPSTGDPSSRTLSQQLLHLHNKLARSNKTADDIRVQLFKEQNRVHRLATSLGFNDITEAERAIEHCPHIYNQDAILYNDTRVRDIPDIQQLTSYKAALRSKDKEIQELRESLTLSERRLHYFEDDAARLRSLRDDAREVANAARMKRVKGDAVQSSDSNQPRQPFLNIDNMPVRPSANISSNKADSTDALGEIENLRVQLRRLRQSYDAIQAKSQRAYKKYRGDYASWRSVKHALNVVLDSDHSRKEDLEQIRLRMDQFIPSSSEDEWEGDPTLIASFFVTKFKECSESPTESSPCEAPLFAGGRPPPTEDEQFDKSPRPSKKRRRTEILADRSGSRYPLIMPSGDHVTGKMQNREGPTLVADAALLPISKRGRYDVAKQKDNGVTINAEYEINAEDNGGLPFQYDVVERRKGVRRKMEADDCEDCRAYYKAVGPLPPRLQQPLWRSPSASQSTQVPPPSHRCRSCYAREKSYEDGDSPDIDFPSEAQGSTDQHAQDHRQEISRHRHQWARPNTPPNYWQIGFPSTQEAVDMNKRAADLHRQKRDSVAREARSGGKYKKR